MSEREWKPGDVAVASYDGEVKVYLRQRKGAFAGATDRWMSSDGTVSKAFGLADWHRLLVVIDPEDAEQVERVRKAFGKNGCLAINRTADAQAALRSLVAPEKPAEPTGLGAVVEDAGGRRWVRGDSTGRNPWTLSGAGLAPKWSEFADIAAVEVLSEGVTA